MGLLTLYSGLLLPWLGGTLWLVFAESRFNTQYKANRLRQAGYGFFLGYAILFIAIMANRTLMGSVSWAGLMVFLLIFTISGGFVAWRSRLTGMTIPQVPAHVLGKAMKLLFAFMLTLMLVHLVFVITEIFSRAVYPWDAWLAWVYRAKAWFLSGNMSEIVSAIDWAGAETAETYTIGAWRYPLFASVIPYWAALSLGSWSETLVNLPVLFAGIAMGMALYGQCREYGLSGPLSLTICYLLYSIPLFGTHLALAGYADIWMAGFTGLGFVALMRAAILRSAFEKSVIQFVIGFSMIMFGIWIKNEGSVWLLAALAMLLLTNCRPRVLILLISAIIVLALLGFTLGLSHVEIPVIGTLGLVDDRLFIPFIGNFVLEMHDVQAVYWENFLGLGNWNLLWVLVTASLFLGFKSPNRISGYRARRTALSLILVFIGTQLFIFGFTDKGLWADTYTAINRLPLHFVPALLFAVGLIAHASLNKKKVIESTNGKGLSDANHIAGARNSSLLPRRSTQLAVSALAFALVMTGTVVFLSKDLPVNTTKPHQHSATDFQFMLGSGRPAGGHMLVDDFANGFALLSSGPVSIQAESLRVLEYTWLPGKFPRETAFFWRRSDDVRQVLRTDITAQGTHLKDLARSPDWQGEITEFGFLLAGNKGDVTEVGDVLLLPDSLYSRLQLSWRAWAAFEPWSQQSINFLLGGDDHQVISLPLLVTAWLLVTLLLLWLHSRFGKAIQTRRLLITAGLLFLIAWLLLDIRWSANNIRQIYLSLQPHWSGDGQQSHVSGPERDIYQYTQDLKRSELGDKASRILLIGDKTAIDFYLFKAKYDLLPNSVNVTGLFHPRIRPDSLDYVIFFGQATSITNIHGWNNTWKDSLIQINQSEWGTVYRVRK